LLFAKPGYVHSAHVEEKMGQVMHHTSSSTSHVEIATDAEKKAHGI
jgi:hypothetical protein